MAFFRQWIATLSRASASVVESILFRPAPIWLTNHIPVYGDSDGRQMGLPDSRSILK